MVLFILYIRFQFSIDDKTNIVYKTKNKSCYVLKLREIFMRNINLNVNDKNKRIVFNCILCSKY